MDHNHVTDHCTTPGPNLNRAQRRALRLVGAAERTVVRPYHQRWHFTGKSHQYIVTADAYDVPNNASRSITFLCIDENDNVHGTWELDGDRLPDDCIHVAVVANHVLEHDGYPWCWGDGLGGAA